MVSTTITLEANKMNLFRSATSALRWSSRLSGSLFSSSLHGDGQLTLTIFGRKSCRSTTWRSPFLSALCLSGICIIIAAAIH